jgi:hypothetical protein
MTVLLIQLLLRFAPLVLLPDPNQSPGLSHSVKGTFSYQTFALQRHGEPIKQEPLLREFEVLLDDRAWKIRVVLVGNTNFDSFVYSYDGTNLLHNPIPPRARRESGAMQSVTVETSPVPATITSAGGEYPWLAFASGCYFKRQTNSRALSFLWARSRNGAVRRYEEPCRIESSAAPPYLPTMIEYKSTNQGVFVGEDGLFGVIPLPSFFGKGGYTRAVFKSGGFTNVQGRSFPTSFEYRIYRPKPDATTTNDLSCVVIVRGKVTSISTRNQAVDCALPDKSYMVNDLRVSEPNVLYPVRDGHIPAVDSEVVETAREDARRRIAETGN